MSQDGTYFITSSKDKTSKVRSLPHLPLAPADI